MKVIKVEKEGLMLINVQITILFLYQIQMLLNNKMLTQQEHDLQMGE